MDKELALYLGTCILVRDPDNQLIRRDSVANEAILQARIEAEYILERLQKPRFDQTFTLTAPPAAAPDPAAVAKPPAASPNPAHSGAADPPRSARGDVPKSG